MMVKRSCNRKRARCNLGKLVKLLLSRIATIGTVFLCPPPRPAYLSDLSDEQWKLIALHLVLPTGGAPKTTDMREVINAILYQLP